MFGAGSVVSSPCVSGGCVPPRDGNGGLHSLGTDASAREGSVYGLCMVRLVVVVMWKCSVSVILSLQVYGVMGSVCGSYGVVWLVVVLV